MMSQPGGLGSPGPSPEPSVGQRFITPASRLVVGWEFTETAPQALCSLSLYTDAWLSLNHALLILVRAHPNHRQLAVINNLFWPNA